MESVSEEKGKLSPLKVFFLQCITCFEGQEKILLATCEKTEAWRACFSEMLGTWLQYLIFRQCLLVVCWAFGMLLSALWQLCHRLGAEMLCGPF